MPDDVQPIDDSAACTQLDHGRAEPAQSDKLALLKFIVIVKERSDYHVDEVEEGNDSENGEAPYYSDGDEDAAAYRQPPQRQARRMLTMSISEMQADARKYQDNLVAHFDICGLPHVMVPARLIADNGEGLEPGIWNYLVLSPIVAAELDAGEFDLAESIVYLLEASNHRFHASAFPVDDGPAVELFAPSKFMKSSAALSTRDLVARDGETEALWLGRVATSYATVQRLVDLWNSAGEQLDLFAAITPRRVRSVAADKVRFLYEDLLPLGVVTLLAGASGTGKTTLLTELAVSVATSEYGSTWLGREVDRDAASGIVIYISGEDSPAFMQARRNILEPNDRDHRFINICGDGRPITEILAEFRRLRNVSLLIVDPSRKYLQGDESNSTAVDDFLSPLEQFARDTGAAVVVVHHLSKGAAPTSLTQFEKAIRGSQLWFDRPRQILGMFRSGDVTKIGTAKHAAPPPSQKMPMTAFRFDEETLRHVLPVALGNASGDAVEAARVQDQVLAVIRRFNAEGRVVKRTGPKGVFEARAEELTGIPRVSVWTATKRLVELGSIFDAPEGLISAVSGTA